jgi:hypothetical protein
MSCREVRGLPTEHGRPFLWDARTGELRKQTVAKRPPDRRFSAPVWQAATMN